MLTSWASILGYCFSIQRACPSIAILFSRSDCDFWDRKFSSPCLSVNYEILSVPEVCITCAWVVLKVCLNLCQTVRWLCQNCAYSAVSCAKVELASFALWLTFCCFHSLFVLMKFYDATVPLLKDWWGIFKTFSSSYLRKKTTSLKGISVCKKTIKIVY